MRRTPLIALLFVFALVGAACGSAQTQTGAGGTQTGAAAPTQSTPAPATTGSSPAAGDAQVSGDTIAIGSIHPLTGALAIDGVQMDEAIQMAVEDINAAGGISSLAGAQLEVLSADSQGAPDIGQSEAQRLIDEGAIALVGPFQSAVAQNLAVVAQRSEVPLVLDVAVADEIVTPDNDYVFRIQPNATAMGTFGAQFLADVAELTGETVETVGYMHDETAFGTSVFNAFQAEAGELGMEIVEAIPYNPFEVTDLTTEIQRVAAAAPDVLVVTGYYNDGVLLTRNALSVEPDIKTIYGVADGAFDLPQFPQDAPDASEGVMDANYHFDATNERATEIRTRFEERTGDEMRTAAVLAYQAVEVIAQALEDSGASDGVGLAEAIQTVSVEPLMAYPGPIEFDDDGENVNAQPVLMQVQDGEVMQVYPEEFAQSEPRFPAVPWEQ